MKQHLMALGWSTIMATLSMNAAADEVTDAVQEGLQAYKSGDYSQAVGSFNYAAQLVQQLKSDQLSTVVPEPLPGWTADEVQKSSAASMFGGGISISRNYSKEGGSVGINIMADSPVLQSFMMMMSNPMMLGANGGRLTKVAGNKAIVEFNAAAKNGKITVVYANRFLIEVSGHGITQNDLTQYAEKIGYAALDKLN